jgi:4-alpha-glucanotransferase
LTISLVLPFTFCSDSFLDSSFLEQHCYFFSFPSSSKYFISFCFLGWLEDAAYFAAIDDSLNTLNWYEWPEPLKNCHLAALEEVYQSKKDFVRYK